jgi:hypothetical protein
MVAIVETVGRPSHMAYNWRATLNFIQTGEAK